MRPNRTAQIESQMALMLTEGAGRAALRDALAVAERMNRSFDVLLQDPERGALAIQAGAPARIAALLESCTEVHRDRASQLRKRLVKAGGQILLPSHEAYPVSMVQHLGRQAPLLLFAWGDVDLLAAPLAGIVGARKVSETGALLARNCAAALVEEGAVIVSGGAEGVDMAAHCEALRCGGQTVVVLPQGLLTVRLAQPIASALNEGRALLLSEFPPDARWTTLGAVTRNGTLSALARMLCVIEPRKTGGSIRTARFALAQGKRVAVYRSTDASMALHHAGTDDLLDGTGAFTQEHMRCLWATAPKPPGGQTALTFDGVSTV